MDISLSLNAKEVLFHLNYMGYRNVTKEQLKFFMTDLKKLIKYESTSPRVSTDFVHVQAGPSSVNIQRLFEAHTITSKTKQKEKPKEAQPNARSQNRPTTITEVSETKDNNTETAIKGKPIRIKSADATQKRTVIDSTKQKISVQACKKILQPKDKNNDKENILDENVVPAKSKMWIRPKSGGSQVATTRKNARKTDPVSLYQKYQKDWEKFKSNICESSHSDLRWKIREKMMGNH